MAKDGDGATFLTAAGCLAHYIGDACQPLHSFQHSDGLNEAQTGVHSTYEDNMVDAHADDIAAGFGNAVANLTFKPREIQARRTGNGRYGPDDFRPENAAPRDHMPDLR